MEKKKNAIINSEIKGINTTESIGSINKDNDQTFEGIIERRGSIDSVEDKVNLKQ